MHRPGGHSDHGTRNTCADHGYGRNGCVAPARIARSCRPGPWHEGCFSSEHEDHRSHRFFPAATNAARAAARFARKLGDSLLLVRVVEPPVAVYPELRVPEAATFESALRQNNERLMEAATASLREEGLAVEGLVLTGSPAPGAGAPRGPRRRASS